MHGLAATLVPVVCTLIACSGSRATPDPTGDRGASAATCVRDTNLSCVMPIPSYANDVHPILTAACVTCHYPYSTLSDSSLTSYADVQKVSGSVLGQVSSCLMPPPGQPPLSESDRGALLDWLVCGAPEN